MALTVHHLERSRSQRILWLLEELGVPYTLQIYQRDPLTQLAPAALKRVHPLGKSPVITDGPRVVAESGAIIEYLVDTYGALCTPELAQLRPAQGSEAHHQCRFWMHYAEGSLMNWLLMHVVFDSIPRQPMPFWVRPIARALCRQVQAKLVQPNVHTAAQFLEAHLAQHRWMAGEALTMADFQMGFAVQVLLSANANALALPHVQAYWDAIQARPAYQRALARGGPALL